MDKNRQKIIEKSSKMGSWGVLGLIFLEIGAKRGLGQCPPPLLAEKWTPKGTPNLGEIEKMGTKFELKFFSIGPEAHF